MLLVVLLVLALTFVQAMLPGRYLSLQVGNARQMGPRDDLPEPSEALARSRRALANLHETLPIFLTLALLSLMLGETGWISVIGAWTYFLFRVAHVVCYMKALTPWRSIAFALSCLGLLAMAVPLVPHI